MTNLDERLRYKTRWFSGTIEDTDVSDKLNDYDVIPETVRITTAYRTNYNSLPNSTYIHLTFMYYETNTAKERIPIEAAQKASEA